MLSDGKLLQIKSHTLTLNLITNQGSVQWGKKEGQAEGFEVGESCQTCSRSRSAAEDEMDIAYYLVWPRVRPLLPLLVYCHTSYYSQMLCASLHRKQHMSQYQKSEDSLLEKYWYSSIRHNFILQCTRQTQCLLSSRKTNIPTNANTFKTGRPMVLIISRENEWKRKRRCNITDSRPTDIF